MRPEGSWYAPLAGVLCATLLAAACFLFVSMLGTAVGPFRFDRMLSDALTAKPLGLWHPPSSRALADAAGDAWRGVLPGDLDVADSADLAELVAAGADPIVVADARSLDAREIDAVRERIAAGGTIVLAGWIAVRDAQGRARDRTAMAGLLGVAKVTSLRAQRLARRTRGPLASGIETALALPTMEAVPALLEPGELCWTDAEDRPAAPGCGALRLVRLGSGTLLWIAAQPPASASADWRTLYRSALAAALRRPTQEVLDVPGGPALPGAELAAWRAARAAVRTELETVTSRRVRLRVSNEGAQSARRIAVRLYLNRAVARGSVQASTLFTNVPRIVPGPERLDLELPDIPARASRTYIVDVEP